MSKQHDSSLVDDVGSRDVLRQKLKRAEDILTEAAIEIGKLRANNTRRIEYRYADTYLGMAMCQLELARIVMRKRKRADGTKKEEVPAGSESLAEKERI